MISTLCSALYLLFIITFCLGEFFARDEDNLKEFDQELRNKISSIPIVEGNLEDILNLEKILNNEAIKKHSKETMKKSFNDTNASYDFQLKFDVNRKRKLSKIPLKDVNRKWHSVSEGREKILSQSTENVLSNPSHVLANSDVRIITYEENDDDRTNSRVKSMTRAAREKKLVHALGLIIPETSNQVVSAESASLMGVPCEDSEERIHFRSPLDFDLMNRLLRNSKSTEKTTTPNMFARLKFANYNQYLTTAAKPKPKTTSDYLERFRIALDKLRKKTNVEYWMKSGSADEATRPPETFTFESYFSFADQKQGTQITNSFKTSNQSYDLVTLYPTTYAQNVTTSTKKSTLSTSKTTGHNHEEISDNKQTFIKIKIPKTWGDVTNHSTTASTHNNVTKLMASGNLSLSAVRKTENATNLSRSSFISSNVSDHQQSFEAQKTIASTIEKTTTPTSKTKLKNEEFLYDLQKMIKMQYPNIWRDVIASSTASSTQSNTKRMPSDYVTLTTVSNTKFATIAEIVCLSCSSQEVSTSEISTNKPHSSSIPELTSKNVNDQSKKLKSIEVTASMNEKSTTPTLETLTLNYDGILGNFFKFMLPKYPEFMRYVTASPNEASTKNSDSKTTTSSSSTLTTVSKM